MARNVFATKTVGVGGVTLRQGDVWDADCEMVREYPQFFSDEPTRVLSGGPRHARAQVIETATRRPGEKRRTPGNKAAPKPAADSEDDG